MRHLIFIAVVLSAGVIAVAQQVTQETVPGVTNFKRLDRVRTLADTRGVAVSQISLAYSLNHPLKPFVLVGHYSGAEAAASVAACDIKLSPAEMDWLDLKRDSLP